MQEKTLAERAREHAPKNRRQPPGFTSAHDDAMHQQKLQKEYFDHLVAEAEADSDRRVKEAEEAQAATSPVQC